MRPIPATILLHVGAGATWMLATLAIALRRQAGAALLTLQMTAALTTLLAGIALWGVLHGGPMGPRGHLLAVGTVCAFLALGLQIGVAGAAAKSVLTGGTLALVWASVALLALAAAAMVGARYVS